MYIESQKELYGRQVEVLDYGFASFDPIYTDGGLYIHFLYIKPECRKTGKGRDLLRFLREKYEVIYFSGYIDKTSKTYKESLLAHIKAGYDIVGATDISLVVTLDAGKI